MSNVRYELSEKTIPGFEPQLLYLSVSKYGSDWMSTLHYHPHMEVLFVMEGEGFFHLDEKKYPIGRGSLVVVNPNRYHTESSSEKSALEIAVIGVDNLFFDFKKREFSDTLEEEEQSPPVFDFSEYYGELRDLIRQINRELLDKPQHYQVMSHYLAYVMLLKVIRHANLRAVVQHDGFVTKECSFAKQYIDEHFAEDISIDLLASKTYVNKYHLIHAFSRSFGISPISYLMEKRIAEAKYLLRGTHMSITEISKATGFSSPSFFAKRFKTSVNLSPLDYRKKMTPRAGGK